MHLIKEIEPTAVDVETDALRSEKQWIPSE